MAYEDIKRAIAASRAAAEIDHDSRLRAAKTPAMMAYQRKELTDAQYLELVGESYVDSVAKNYRASMRGIKRNVAERVAAGNLTAEDYLSITGEAYPEEVIV